MTLERAFEVLSNSETRVNINEPNEAIHIACKALAEKIERDNPKPLTLVDITFMSGKPIYVSSLGNSYWAIVAEVDMRGKSFTLVSEIDSEEERSFSLYGKTWLAYKYKPKGV